MKTKMPHICASFEMIEDILKLSEVGARIENLTIDTDSREVVIEVSGAGVDMILRHYPVDMKRLNLSYYRNAADLAPCLSPLLGVAY